MSTITCCITIRTVLLTSVIRYFEVMGCSKVCPSSLTSGTLYSKTVGLLDLEKERMLHFCRWNPFGVQMVLEELAVCFSI